MNKPYEGSESTGRKTIPLPNQSTLLAQAHRFATEMKWPVFPIYEVTSGGRCACEKIACDRKGKHPRTKDGLKSATTSEAQITGWWNQWPHANIGIATGRQSGFFVLDIDPKNGGNESLKSLIRQHGKLPGTVKVSTGGGGRHFYFQMPQFELRNKTNILSGIDVRAEGGYIIAPPSNHASGGMYEWAEERGPSDVEILPAPEWLLLLLRNKPKPVKVDEEEVGSFKEGARNSSVTRVAGTLRSHGLSGQSLVAALHAVNKNSCKPPLSDSEVESIAQSISKYPNHSATPLTWSEIKDLPQMSLQAPALDIKMIPSPLRKWAVDVCERMQVSLDFLIPPAIVAASSVIGRQLAMRPKEHDSFEVVPNLWGAVVAPPSTLKSPALTEALSPVYELIRIAASDYENVKFDAEMEVVAIESELKNLEKQLQKNRGENRDQLLELVREKKQKLAQVQPKERRFISNDPTIEKLAELQRDNPTGILVYRDELTGFLFGLEKPGHESDRSFYLEGWNGNGRFRVDRIGRGSIPVHGMCLSLLGGIQPSRLKQYIHDVVSNAAGNDGFIQRFQLLIYPEQRKQWTRVDRLPLSAEKDRVNKVFRELADLDNLALQAVCDDENQIPFLKFSAEAQVIYNEWIEKLENRLLNHDSESEAMQTHLGKYRSLMPSLSLIFHLLNFSDHKMTEARIHPSVARLAIKWCDYLEGHARKVYGLLGELQLDSSKAFVKKVNEGRIKDGDSLRDIYRHNWSHLKTVKDVDAAIALLKDHGWVQTQFLPTGGAPTEVIRINPKWLEKTKVSADRTDKSQAGDPSVSSVTSETGQIH